MAEERTNFQDTLKVKRKIQAVESRVSEIEAKPVPKAAPPVARGVTWVKPASIWTKVVTGSGTENSFSSWETIDFSTHIKGAQKVYVDIRMTNTRGTSDLDEVYLAIDWRLSVRHGAIHAAGVTLDQRGDEVQEFTSYSVGQFPVNQGKAEIRYMQSKDNFSYEIRVYGYE